MSFQVYIQDDFLPRDQFEYLRDFMTSHGGAFPWGLSDIVYPIGDPRAEHTPASFNYQFVHMFYDEGHGIRSEYMDLVEPLIAKINPSKLLRVKANLNPCTYHWVVQHDYHIDIGNEDIASKATTAVYCINSNDGWTAFDLGPPSPKLEDELPPWVERPVKRNYINSCANRLISFPATVRHAGTSCTEDPYRVVININYIK